MPSIRIDKILYYLRLVKSRSAAQAIVEAGHIRVNGHRVERMAHAVGLGDILTLPIGDRVRIIRIIDLPCRRGPPAEAHGCYQELDGASYNLIAGELTEAALKRTPQP